MTSLVVTRATLVRPNGRHPATLVVADGRIQAILPPEERPSADTVIDAKGRFVIPGVIDPHVHLGLSQSFEDACWSESRAAVTGGVTSMMHYIITSDSFFSVYEKHRIAVEAHSLVDIGFHGMVQNDRHVEELARTAVELPLTSYKFHMAMKGPEAAYGIRGVDDGLIYEGLQEVGKLPNVLALIHAENIDVILRFRDRMIQRWQQDPASANWSDYRPAFTEEEAISRAALLAEHAGAPLGIVHTSVGRGPELLARARLRYAPLYMETCPQYLVLNRGMGLGVRGKVNPPLREPRDCEMLWHALAVGEIDWMGSDHCDYDLRSRVGELWDVGPGLPSGVTMILPVLLSEGVNRGRLTLEQVVQLTSANAARIFGFAPAKGTLEVGSDADLVVLDMDARVVITPAVLNSFSDYTPYEGMTMTGWPRTTVVGGEVAYHLGEVNDSARHRGRVLSQAGRSDPVAG